jgi:hypothetical protein
VDWLKAIAMRQEHDHPFKVIGQAAARITALSAEVAEKDAALAELIKAANELSAEVLALGAKP